MGDTISRHSKPLAITYYKVEDEEDTICIGYLIIVKFPFAEGLKWVVIPKKYVSSNNICYKEIAEGIAKSEKLPLIPNIKTGFGVQQEVLKFYNIIEGV